MRLNQEKKTESRPKLKAAAILILILTNLATGGFLIYKIRQNSLLDNPYPLIDISRNFIAQENFISTLQPIREYLQELAAKEGSDAISVYIEYLNTGANISINQDLRIFPALLVKVPLAMAVMKKIEKGDWAFHNELVVMKEDRDYLWGDLHRHPVGTTITIEKLIEEMLLNSDNTAFRILYRNLSFDELQDVIAALGLDELFSEEGKISAKEYTRLFRSLYISSYLKRENSQKILKILSKTTYENYLGQGIPDEVLFSHKIGDNEDVGVMLDAGIVYVSDRPYLIAVMIDYKEMGREKAMEILKNISSQTYSYIDNYGKQ